MDFSSIPRALESLQRRQPPLPDDILEASKELSASATVLENLKVLLCSCETEQRWEPLAVGLHLSTECLLLLLLQKQQEQQRDTVYMDGPRVPDTKDNNSNNNTTAALAMQLEPDLPSLCSLLHTTCLHHLEHPEPRVRTLVAKAVGVMYRPQLFAASDTVASSVQELHHTLLQSIAQHIVDGRQPVQTKDADDDADNNKTYSQTTTGAMDDTTGWRALETNWLCLASLVQSLPNYATDFGIDNSILEHLHYSAVTHLNRHVRAAALQVLEQLVWALDRVHLLLVNGASPKNTSTVAFHTTVRAVLKEGLADNWSQVRMAASVLCRVYMGRLLQQKDGTTTTTTTLDTLTLQTLLPRMCLNRFYLAQGVKLYSHETWKELFGDGSGLRRVQECLPAVVRYYVKMCDADNHVVREGACQAIAELAVRMPSEALEQHISTLLQALIMCFHDESWPVRDEACLACGSLCKAYPDECLPEFNLLWERWTEQLTDQIWSVRADAAVALGDALEAYGETVLDKLRVLIQKIMPSARDQPAMTPTEYKAHVNDIEQHTNSQLYSCGSLAPKLRKGGAGRIGCSSCGVDRPKAPWEATDGCIYLITELIFRGTKPESKTPMADDELVPMLTELADVCRVQHFPQSDELRATLWKCLPGMANALGKQRFKSKYLAIFMDLLFYNLESRTASQLSKHAAGQCVEELANLVGKAIFRGRLEEYQQDLFDSVMRERQTMPKGPGAGDVFSPFGPPGLLDGVQPPKNNVELHSI